MKKKIITLFSVIILCLACSGCEGNITRGIRHAGFSVVNNKFICNAFISTDNNYINRIKYLGNTYAIDEDGIVFDISLNQLYSNQQNCKKSSLPTTVAAIIDDRVIKGTDGKLYYLVPSSNTPAYSEVTVSDSAYQIYQVLLQDTEVVKAISVNQNQGTYYVLKTDGDIYKYVINRNDTQSPYNIISKEVIYSSNSFGRIIDFNYNNSAKLSTYIKTDNSLYRLKVLNKEECSKYVDKECDYEMYEDKALMKYREHIIGFNGNLLITDYGREFSVAG